METEENNFKVSRMEDIGQFELQKNRNLCFWERAVGAGTARLYRRGSKEEICSLFIVKRYILLM